MKNIYEILIENAANKRLDEIILLDKEYCAINEQINAAQQQYLNLHLPKEHTEIIDRIICLYTEESARHSVLSYKQGMLDAVELLKSMGVFSDNFYHCH